MRNVPQFIFRLLLGQRAPIVRGTLEVAGVRQPVLIRRDTYGIPYIEAESDEDAWYGLGFCHGQDRAFQLESLVRVVRGTLAELIGPDGLVMDRFSRRIGFQRASEQQWAVIDGEIRQWIEAYTRGINDGVRISPSISLRCDSFQATFPSRLIGPYLNPRKTFDGPIHPRMAGLRRVCNKAHSPLFANEINQLLRGSILASDGPLDTECEKVIVER